ncbi:oxygenase MpaB family protein [Marisediminicola antarctica]|uniref:ER-bound oxygenase mpaB/mpaB'/Rubber oxygenase catalytic domain-containing protein n=1 Tax=Marisediminicola antarctica TaxID=674079 RepID=A0A7L5AGI9_9MICO|nr:oxygenase MpaB family protein [Marisediminicola antarctica]QHO69102.1 hypothetical protein BHD05_05010 [Marisediminicola antarctica]
MQAEREERGLADIGAEAVLIAGGGRAILLQLANPAIGHAIARHSNFADGPIDRLRHTLGYVYAIVDGSPAQVAAVRERVNRRHAPVKSSPGAAPPYDATDAALQLWVAATLYDTAMLVHERLIGTLSDADLDRVYADYAAIGTSLQVPPELWPVDRAAFSEYWRSQLSGLRVDATTRGVAEALLYPRTGPLWLRLAMPLARLVTAGLLPASIRTQFRFAWGPRRERRFELAIAAIRAVNRVLPSRLRRWPKNALLREIG